MSEAADPRHGTRASRLAERALALPEAQRAGFLAEATGGDAELAREVAARLADSTGSRPSTTQGGAASAGAAPREAVSGHLDPWVGMALGDCRLTRRIAGGGMGVVYEARQDPPGRQVAVKILRTSLATDEGRMRFEHETRTLAGLRHPGIAQIYEAGTHVSPEGERLPYFVMEHVPGARTITAFAEAEGLDLRAKLALFVRVCAAVHFGHTRGVIHRDLKPGNLLVDAEGTPKVIDFGIARTAESDEENPSPRTETGQLVGTLPYMSPEQIVGPSLGIDTRSDVYALGVILYELLTGRLPYDLDDLNLIEVAAVIAQRPPLPPSRFAPEAAGDVSVILQKALAKEPDRRYASAASFQHDLERFLAFQPIQARPPSAGYQLRLFARRNRAGFLAAVGALLALVAATVLSLWFASSEATARRAAERQRARAENLLAQTRTLVPWLLGAFDREVAALPGSLLSRSRLADRLREYLSTLQVTEQDHPDVLRAAAIAHGALGDVLGGRDEGHLGRQPEALEQYRLAVGLWDQLLQRFPEDDEARQRRAEVRLVQGRVLNEQGAPGDARAAVEDAVAEVQRLSDRRPAEASLRAELLGAWRGRANQAWADGRYEEALADYRRVLAGHEAEPPAVPAEDRLRAIVSARLDLGTALLELQRAAEAEPLLAQVRGEVDRLEAPTGNLSDLRLARYVHSAVGQARLSAGQFAEAAREAGGALACAERWAERDAHDASARVQVRNAHGLLGRIAEQQGLWTEAESQFRAAVELGLELAAGEPPESNLRWDLRVELMKRGNALGRLGRFAEARAELLRALEQARARRRVRAREAYAVLGECEVLRALAALPGLRWNLASRLLATAGPILGARPLGWDPSPAVAALRQQIWISNLAESHGWLSLAATAFSELKSLGAWGAEQEAELARIARRLEAMAAELKTSGR